MIILTVYKIFLFFLPLHIPLIHSFFINVIIIIILIIIIIIIVIFMESKKISWTSSLRKWR